MANKIRFGKIESWILWAAYLKTVKKTLPDNWIADKHPCHIKEPDYLYKTEILLNLYPNLERSRHSSAFYYYSAVKFRATPEYRKALVTIHKAVNSLWSKGLIVYKNFLFHNGDNIISLTFDGIQKAKTLKVNKVTKWDFINFNNNKL